MFCWPPDPKHMPEIFRVRLQALREKRARLLAEIAAKLGG